MFEYLISGVENLVLTLGPLGIFLAMLTETVFPPIPSEIVMPLGGYVAYTSGLGLPFLALMIVAGSIGSTVGSLILYELARRAGRHVVARHGRWMFLDEKKLKTAEKWFSNHGDHAVFLCRMAPGLREIISIPAGLAKMDRSRFTLLTFGGSLVWSAFLGGIGFFLADAWTGLGLENFVSTIGLVIILAFISYLVFRHFVNSRKKRR